MSGPYGVGQLQGMMAQQANGYSTAAQQAGAANGPMARHAEVVHQLAGDIQSLNQRLCSALDRITGPCPEMGEDAKDKPPPQGALLVAQFGAERIQLTVSRLSELVNRLEAIVS